jgi:exopolysaccharide biosynthesis protein
MSPGVVYKKMVETVGSINTTVFILEVDMTEPTVQFQSAKALDLLAARQKTSAMVTAKTSNDYHNVIGAINGDFFNLTTGVPDNLQVVDGELIKSSGSTHSLIGFTDGKVPFVSYNSNTNTLVASGGATAAITQINKARTTEDLVLYNRFQGGSTGTDTTGTEIKIAPVRGWKANAAVDCTVLAKVGPGSGNMTFTTGQAVLSGTGTGSTFLTNNVNVGDTITLILDGSDTAENVPQAIGSFPKIVENGLNCVAASIAHEGSLSHFTESRVRSGIGFSADKKTLHMLVVQKFPLPTDGSSPQGMTVDELANFMISQLGIYTGVNQDGGGSSTLVANGVIKNVPTDATGERDVSNSLLVYLASRTLDDFEAGVGHFNQAPTASPVTVGIATSSSISQQQDINVHSGYGSMKVVLNDNTSVSTPWTVCLLSGSGTAANNTSIYDARGKLSFVLKTSTAAAGATVRIRIDDVDGTEESPAFVIKNDGAWHKYTWDLETFNGTSPDTGNGRINGPTVTLDSIVLAQPNTASTWTLYIDDLLHDKADIDAGLVNLASSATLSVDSTNGTSTKDKAVDGNRASDTSRWLSADVQGDHWFELDWPANRTISRVKIWSGTPSSAGWQVSDFQIQQWTGSAWATVTNAGVPVTVTANTSDVAYGQLNDLVFDPVVTTKIRMYITNPCVNATSHMARLGEIEVFGPNLATSATLAVDSTKDSYTAGRAVDGNKLSSDSRWISADLGVGVDHWFELDWPTTKTVSGVKIWSGSANQNFQISDFEMRYWNGSTWVAAAPQIINNTKDGSLGQFNDIVFPSPVSTTKLRMYITKPCVTPPPGSFWIARLFEIEAY